MSRKDTESFKRQIWTVFALMGFIPFLVNIYFLTSQDIEITREIYILGATVFIGILVSFFIIVHFAEDLSKLSKSTAQFTHGQNKELIKTSKGSLSEVDTLTKSFNGIIKELKESKVHSREDSTRLLVYASELKKHEVKSKNEALVRAKLSRYVGGDVLDHLVQSGKGLPIQNVRREVTVLFADIRSFTTLSENIGPEEVIDMLNEYFTIMVEIIFKHQGILDKFVGDELMAVFGMIGPKENAPLDAISAALEMRQAQDALMERRSKQGKKTFEVGTGINTGEAVVGSVGSPNRSDFTVIGDTVNIGARFEQMAQGREIIVGERTYQHCVKYVRMEKKGDIKVRNRSEFVASYIVKDKLENLA